MIELMIALVMVGMLGTVIVTAISGSGNDLSLGINGISESRCIGGYKFIIGQGGGIHCEQ